MAGPSSEPNRKRFQLPPGRIENQPKAFNRRCPQKRLVTLFSENHKRVATLSLILENVRSDFAAHDFSVRQNELMP